MQTNKLWEFPVPSTYIADGGVKLIYPGGDALLLFDYYDKEKNLLFLTQVLCLMQFKHIDILQRSLSSRYLGLMIVLSRLQTPNGLKN